MNFSVYVLSTKSCWVSLKLSHEASSKQLTSRNFFSSRKKLFLLGVYSAARSLVGIVLSGRRFTGSFAKCLRLLEFMFKENLFKKVFKLRPRGQRPSPPNNPKIISSTFVMTSPLLHILPNRLRRQQQLREISSCKTRILMSLYGSLLISARAEVAADKRRQQRNN